MRTVEAGRAAGPVGVAGLTKPAPGDGGYESVGGDFANRVVELVRNKRIADRVQSDARRQIEVGIGSFSIAEACRSEALDSRERAGNPICTNGSNLSDQIILVIGDVDRACPKRAIFGNLIIQADDGHNNYESMSFSG